MKLLDKIITKVIYKYCSPRIVDNPPELLDVMGRNKLYFKLKTFKEDYWSKLFLSAPKVILKEPIFVVGAPRSGTTFLGDCLSSIPSVSYFFEPVFTKSLGYLVASDKLDVKIAQDLFLDTYSKLMSTQPKQNHFCEKTPSNVFIIENLLKWFPDAKFIHIVRNGVDMTASHVEKGWLTEKKLEPLSYEIGGYRNGAIPQFWVESERDSEFRNTSDAHRSIWAWRTHVEAGRASGEKLDAKHYLEIRYEDLLRDPKRLSKIIASDFLGLEKNDEKLLYNSISKGHTNSIDRGYSKLNNADKDSIKKEAGKLLDELGYASPT